MSLSLSSTFLLLSFFACLLLYSPYSSLYLFAHSCFFIIIIIIFIPCSSFLYFQTFSFSPAFSAYFSTFFFLFYFSYFAIFSILFNYLMLALNFNYCTFSLLFVLFYKFLLSLSILPYCFLQ